MAFDETKVERDQSGKFSEKAGSAPEVSLTASAKPKLRKVNKGTGNYGKRLETADVRVGEPEELVEGSGWMRTPLYLDGQRVGYVSERTNTPTKKVSRGISRSLKPRTEFLVELHKNYGGARDAYPSRTRAIFSVLERAISRGDIP